MTRFLVTLTLAGFMLGCGGDDLPSRDQIPVLRARLFALEQGIRDHSRAAIDSLLSVDILDVKQSSDSLLRFVYGPGDTLPFVRLGDYTIFFSREMAVIDCFIMDSTEQPNRPLRLMYKLDDDLWLLREFREGHPDSTALR